MRELIESQPTSIDKPLIVGSMTREKLISFMQVKRQLLLLATEFASYFTKARYQDNLLPFLVELADLPQTFHHLGAKKDGNGNGITIEDPQLIMACASTVEWLYSASAEAAVSGGFMPRMFAIYEDQKRQKIVLPKRFLGKDGLGKHEIDKKQLVQDFDTCVNFHKGEIDLEDKAADLFVEWAENYKPVSPSLGAFAERAREFVMRLALLISTSCFEDSISRESIKCAIQLYLYSQKRLEEVVIPLSLLGKLHKQILTLIEKSPAGLNRTEIRNSMLHTLSAPKTDEIVASLVACERIKEREGRFIAVESKSREPIYK